MVDDYDKAIDFFIRKLHFVLIEDKVLSEDKRWVLIKPNGTGECCILLAKASTKEQSAFIGTQSGGRVFLFLFTDNFNRDYMNLIENKITIEREPREESYGRVAVFRDIYGNLWDLIQPMP
jgi:catechol 2,3-dioxygenase-like lactoylglutathione lyase family enzyme